MQAFKYLPALWTTPLLVVGITYIIYLQLGWVAFIPSAIVTVLIPLQIGLAKCFTKIRYSMYVQY